MKKLKFRCSKCKGVIGWIECVDSFDLNKSGIDEALCKECGKEINQDDIPHKEKIIDNPFFGDMEKYNRLGDKPEFKKLKYKLDYITKINECKINLKKTREKESIDHIQALIEYFQVVRPLLNIEDIRMMEDLLNEILELKFPSQIQGASFKADISKT